MRTLVIAPHPDDELLGCGGLIMRRTSESVRVGWVIMSSMTLENGWSLPQVAARQAEITKVAEGLGIRPEDVFQLGFPTTQLDQVPMAKLVQALSDVFGVFEPTEVLAPHSGDVHSDHRITAEVVDACTKWFRYPSVQRVLAYETLSETGFGRSTGNAFNPNVFIDISSWLDLKLELLGIYASEMGEFPFPRSEGAVRALAHLRGSRAGFKAAEAFELLAETH